MKASFDRKSLLAALTAVSGAVPNKTPKPVLQNIRLHAADGEATVTATDLEIGIHWTIRFPHVERPGTVLLPGRFVQIVRLATDDTIYIDSEEGTIRVKAGRSSWELPSEDPDLFPSVPEFAADDYYVVSDGQLKSAIRRVIFALDDKASTRYAMGGSLWEFDGRCMSMVGCDGRRLAKAVVDCESVGNPDHHENKTAETAARNVAPIVPPKTLKMIDRLIGDDGNEVHIAVNPQSHVLIRTTDAEIYTRLIEGRYPRYQDAFPAKANHVLEIVASDLLSGVSQAAILTSEETRGVQFDFNIDNLTLSINASDRGAAKIVCPMPNSEGIGFPIKFDPGYLEPMLRAIPDDAKVSIRVDNSKSGVVFEFDNSYNYLVMPITK